MRTKEKFYENLNNNHVSSEKRLERVDLRSVKHIESIIKDMSSLKSKGDKIEAKYREESNLAADYYEGANKLDAYQEKLEKALVVLKKENASDEQKKQIAINEQETLFVKMYALYSKTQDKADVLENNVRGVEADAQDLIQRLEVAKKDFIANGKSIGVDVSSKANSYDHPNGWPWN